MGKASRDKGARGERSLVMHLNLKGYDARRVIRTRAVGGYENDDVPDVTAVKDGIEYTFESKVRKDAFKTIYALYNRERGAENVCRLAIGGRLVVLGTDFEEVKRNNNVYFRDLAPTTGPEEKTRQRLLNLKKLLKGAQYLVIKDNGKHHLFLRFL